MAKNRFSKEGYPPAADSDPTAHTRTGDFDVDLNTASYHQLVVIPTLGRERARALVEARPIRSWEQVRDLPDFNDEVVENLRKGGARIRKVA